MKALGVNQTEAILLHSRNYSETSLICELFTRKHGRVSVIAKGARSKKNKFQNIAAPNILASVNYSGKSELKTLVSWEEITHFSILGKNLKILLYLNELIFKLLEKENNHDGIFESLIDFYKVLVSGDAKNIEIALREFEYFLICELGYGFNLLYDDNGKKIVREKTYYFHPAQGFSEKPLNNFLKVSGIDIIDFTNGKITSSSARSKKRKIMQLAFSFIAEKPLNAVWIFNV